MERSESRIILLDANLLVLLVIGATSRHLIAKHKKSKMFTPRDFDRLVAILGDHRILILPHIAAEASNLVSFHDEPERKRLLKAYAAILGVIQEKYVVSRHATQQSEFSYLGLTDAAILLADSDAEILTTDAKLHIAASKRGLLVTNFNHQR